MDQLKIYIQKQQERSEKTTKKIQWKRIPATKGQNGEGNRDQER